MSIASDVSAVTGTAEESATSIVRIVCEAAVGWPEITPAELRVRPSGNVAEFRDHTYGGVPPVAAREALYGASVVAEGNCVVVICREEGCVVGGWLGAAATSIASEA